jgi:hypothetical protein
LFAAKLKILNAAIAVKNVRQKYNLWKDIKKDNTNITNFICKIYTMQFAKKSNFEEHLKTDHKFD